VKVTYTPAERPEETLREPSMRATIRTLLALDSTLLGRNCTITYIDDIKLTPAMPLPLDECIEIVASLTNFLLMCARRSVELRYIRGILESGEMISFFGVTRRQKRRPTAREWVLTLSDIGTLQNALDAWFSLVRRMRFVGPVFFSELTNPSDIQDARFFHFAGCLEAFHREVVQGDAGKFVPKQEFREITRSVLDHLPPTVPPGLRDSMRSALGRANDHSFAERISALFNGLEPDTQRQLTTEPRCFLDAIKHSRNKLAHVTEEPPGEAFEGREFAHANLVIQGWLTILMLKECGVSESLILKKMNGIGYFYWGPFKFESRKASGRATGAR
jgi:hypothetical protein